MWKRKSIFASVTLKNAYEKCFSTFFFKYIMIIWFVRDNLHLIKIILWIIRKSMSRCLEYFNPTKILAPYIFMKKILHDLGVKIGIIFIAKNVQNSRASLWKRILKDSTTIIKQRSHNLRFQNKWQIMTAFDGWTRSTFLLEHDHRKQENDINL